MLRCPGSALFRGRTVPPVSAGGFSRTEEKKRAILLEDAGRRGVLGTAFSIAAGAVLPAPQADPVIAAGAPRFLLHGSRGDVRIATMVWIGQSPCRLGKLRCCSAQFPDPYLVAQSQQFVPVPADYLDPFACFPYDLETKKCEGMKKFLFTAWRAEYEISRAIAFERVGRVVLVPRTKTT